MATWRAKAARVEPRVDMRNCCTSTSNTAATAGSITCLSWDLPRLKAGLTSLTGKRLSTVRT